jgi:hypothetical protein
MRTFTLLAITTLLTFGTEKLHERLLKIRQEREMLSKTTTISPVPQHDASG